MRADIQAFDKDVPDLADAVDVRIQGDRVENAFRPRLVQHQRAGSSGLGEDREVHSRAMNSGTQGQGMSARNRVSLAAVRVEESGTFCSGHDRWPRATRPMHGYQKAAREQVPNDDRARIDVTQRL